MYRRLTDFLLILTRFSFPSDSSLSRDFEEIAKRNAQLEQNFIDLQGTLKSKDADLRDHLDRTQKAELEVLKAKRERSAFEEKVFLYKVIVAYSIEA